MTLSLTARSVPVVCAGSVTRTSRRSRRARTGGINAKGINANGIKARWVKSRPPRASRRGRPSRLVDPLQGLDDARAPRPATVGASKRLRSGTSTPKACVRRAQESGQRAASGRRARRSCRGRRRARRPSTSRQIAASRLLDRRPRRAHVGPCRDGAASGAGSALRSTLPFGRERQRVEQRRTPPAPCTSGSCSREVLAQRRRLRRGVRAAHDVGDEPLVAAAVLARHDHRLAAPRGAGRAPPRSRRARCGSRGSSPGGRCGPRYSRSPSSAAGARGRRSGRAARPASRRTDRARSAPPSAPAGRR